MKQIFAGLLTEGSTDNRFFENVINRVIDEISCKNHLNIEFDLFILKKNGNSFNKQVINATQEGLKRYGVSIVFIHADADSSTNSNTLNTKFNPLFKEIEQFNEKQYCKNIVPIIPIHETESWLIADMELFKEEINTTKTNAELGLSQNPETIKNPKEKIENALYIINQEKPKKRRKDLKLSELYQILGQTIELDQLKKLSSFNQFYQNTIVALRKINILNS